MQKTDTLGVIAQLGQAPAEAVRIAVARALRQGNFTCRPYAASSS